MKYKQLMTTIFCMATSACSYTTMTESTYDSSSHRYSTKVYSKYYDAGDWLMPNHLGASVVADHMKKRIPVVYGAQQSIGALGPEDSEAKAKITIYIWNFDAAPHSLTNIQLSSGGQELQANKKVIKALPKARTQVDLGVIDVFDSGKKIPVTMNYTVDGKRITQSLTLIRRTTNELRGFYSPQGQLPYPWHARVNELND